MSHFTLFWLLLQIVLKLRILIFWNFHSNLISSCSIHSKYLRIQHNSTMNSKLRSGALFKVEQFFYFSLSKGFDKTAHNPQIRDLPWPMPISYENISNFGQFIFCSPLQEPVGTISFFKKIDFQKVKFKAKLPKLRWFDGIFC